MTTPTASSLAEFYADPASPYAAFPQEHRSGGSLPVTMMRAEQDAHEFVDLAIPEVVLVLVLVSDTTFRWDVGDGYTETAPMRAGYTTVIVPNTRVFYDVRGSHDILNLAIPSAPLVALLDDHRVGSAHSFDALTDAALFRDEAVRRTMLQMWAESARSGGTSDLMMDGLMQVLLARLLDKAGALRRPQRVPLLGQADLSRLDEVVDERMAGRITVEDLARALDMTRWTFADAFRAATGDTPHAYVTAKRIDRACHFLRLGDMPLAEVAYATGFASQSHMTDTFRRMMGTTLGKWRAEVRG